MIDAIASWVNDRILKHAGICVVRRATLDDLVAQNAALRRGLAAQGAQEGLAERDPLDTWVLAQLADGLRLWVDLGDYGVSRPCLFGHYEPEETAFLRATLKPGDTFVDIGANIGWFALNAAVCVGGKGRVIAFEPRPNTCERLALSATANGFDHMEVHPLALGDTPGRLTVASKIAARNPGGTWSLPTEELAASAGAGYERFEVDVARLDDFDLRHCDLLKIDIEGAEYLALSGARETISRLRPVIMSEVNPEPLRIVSGVEPSDYIAAVESLGYRAHHLGDQGPGAPVDARETNSLEGVINIAFIPE